jgi:hypothetical protein
MYDEEEVQSALKGGLYLVAQERIRQIKEKGYTLKHDTTHEESDALACAAASYALPPIDRPMDQFDDVPIYWPWTEDSWNPSPKDRIRELTKAGALICAEIDRLSSV